MDLWHILMMHLRHSPGQQTHRLQLLQPDQSSPSLGSCMHMKGKVLLQFWSFQPHAVGVLPPNCTLPVPLVAYASR